MTLYALGDIDPILIEAGGFSGFDLPSFVTPVRVLSDGTTPGPDEVLQSTGVPSRRAVIKGTLTSSTDCDQLRAYDQTKEVVVFTDGNGNTTNVRVLELTTDDYNDWWTFVAELYMVDPTEPPGS